MKFVARPIEPEVDAFVIVRIRENPRGYLCPPMSILITDVVSVPVNELSRAPQEYTLIYLTPEIVSVYSPRPGDYYVVKPDGSKRCMQKDIFEALYRVV